METSARLLNCVYLSLLTLALIIVSIVFSNVRGMALIVVTVLKKTLLHKILIYYLIIFNTEQESSFTFFSDAAPDFF